MTGDPEPGEGFEVLEGRFEATGIHLRSPTTALALKVVVMLAGFAADKSHYLIDAENAFGPAFAHETFKVAVDGRKT